MASEHKLQNLCLPEDVIVEILSRLPVKTLVRFKCVCTHWSTLISSPLFVSLHLNRSISNPTRHSILVHNKLGDPLMSYDPVTFAPIENTNLGLIFGPNIDYVGSSNGLLCIRSGFSDLCLKIWNPSTRLFKTLPPHMKKTLPPCNERTASSVGFGCNPIDNDYKVVNLCCRFADVKLRTWVEVWSENLQSWREIDVDRSFYTLESVSDVIVKGFAYWIVRDGPGSEHKHLVASFDMRTEVLRLVPVPPELSLCRVRRGTLLRGEQHFVANHYPVIGMNWKGTFAVAGLVSLDPRKLYHVWTMEIDRAGKEIWSKKFTFELDFEFCCLVSSVSGKLVLKRPGELILYDVETRETKTVGTQNVNPWMLRAHYYVESLLSIKGFNPLGEDREKIE